MILAFELTWTGTTHAPGNGATLATVVRALPEHSVRMYAEATHLAELAADPGLAGLATLSLHPVAVSTLHRGRTHVVSWRRGLVEFRALRQALREALHGGPASEPCLILMLSATPTAVFAACLAAWLQGPHVAVQVGLHGNLNEITGWRSRNPLLRAFDLRAAMVSRWTRRARYLVLDPSIRAALADILPEAASRTDVIDLPVNAGERAGQGGAALVEPVRIGFVGQATHAKGIDIFLRLAATLRAEYASRVAFTLVGRAMPGSDLADFAGLADPVGTAHLSRAEFLRRLDSLHYVLLPYRTGYYDLAASGALIDAITWGKPVIATDLPIVAQLFARFGDVGHLCADEAGLLAAMRVILDGMDQTRYATQVAALARAAAARTPQALAPIYRMLIARTWPALVGRGSKGPVYKTRPGLGG